MKWPWTKNKELEEAEEQRREAESRQRQIRPLTKKLEKHNRVNNFAARFIAAGLGGEE